MENCEQIPEDSILITKRNNNNFNIMNRFRYRNVQQTEPSNFRYHIKSLPQCKPNLIRNSKGNEKVDSLISFFQSNKRLVVVSSGKKSSKALCEACVIVNKKGREILSGYNPDFGDISQTNSYRAEIY